MALRIPKSDRRSSKDPAKPQLSAAFRTSRKVTRSSPACSQNGHAARRLTHPLNQAPAPYKCQRDYKYSGPTTSTGLCEAIWVAIGGGVGNRPPRNP
eukprot:4011500-Alexandrium_andersonii.AAC.1